MGHDVIAIAPHKLNTTSIEKLATQLAERFDSTIIYGYVDDWIANDVEGSFEFIEQGRTGINRKQEYLLRDSYYTDRLHYPKHYDIDFELHLKNRYDDYAIDIYETCFSCNTSFDSRWWNFCRCFTGEITDASFLNGLEEYRRNVLEETKRLGGNTAIYTDDQGKSAWVAYGEAMPWNEMLAKLQNDFGEQFVSVSKFFLEKQAYFKEFPLAFF